MYTSAILALGCWRQADHRSRSFLATYIVILRHAWVKEEIKNGRKVRQREREGKDERKEEGKKNKEKNALTGDPILGSTSV